MCLRQRAQRERSHLGELEVDDRVRLRVALSCDQPRLLGPVDQPDRTVMTDDEDLGDLAHGRAARLTRRADRQKQLVLRGRDADLPGLLLAPVQKAAQPVAELRQALVVVVAELAFRLCHVASRYRAATCWRDQAGTTESAVASHG